MINLNFFTAGVCPKVTDDGVLKLLVVNYYDDSDHKKIREYRFPGGTIQFTDVLFTLEKLGSQKLGLTEHKFNFLTLKLSEIAEEAEKRIVKMPQENNEQKIKRRTAFIEFLKKAQDMLIRELPSLSELKIFQREVQLTTLRRELEQEAAVEGFSDAVQCGFAQRGEHTQYPYLVLNCEAPDSYQGGSDKDIEGSSFVSLKDVCEKISRHHKSFLNNTLSMLAQIWAFDKDKSVFVKDIDQCLKETQA